MDVGEVNIPHFRINDKAQEALATLVADGSRRSLEQPLGAVVAVRAVFKDMLVVCMLTGGSVRTLTVTPYN